MLDSQKYPDQALINPPSMIRSNTNLPIGFPSSMDLDEMHILSINGQSNPLVTQELLEVTVIANAPLIVNIPSTIPASIPPFILNTLVILYPGSLLMTLPTVVGIPPSRISLTMVPIDILNPPTEAIMTVLSAATIDPSAGVSKASKMSSQMLSGKLNY